MLESRRVAAAALLLLPAGLVVYFAFNSGGFYPGPTAYVAVALCVVLALRVTLAANPLEGLGWPLALGAGALALYALLTLVSAGWSHAPGVALVNFGLPLVYLLALVLFGSVGHTHERLRWILRLLALGILVVCGCGLVTRLLPHVWPTAPDISNQRLSFPVSYWNVLGALAAVGIVLCVQLSADLAEQRAIRVLAAAATPVLAVTLYFTFSRGAIAVAIIAIVVYALLGRPRGLLSAALAIAPAAAIALKVAYDANVLATSNPNVPHGIVQGHHATAVLAACVVGAAAVRALALALDERMLRVSVPARLRSRGVGRAAWASLAVAVVVVAVAANGAIAHDWHRFVNPAEVGNGNDLRARLTDPGNNGRIDMWKVAWHGFKSAPVVGQGAGTFADTWAQHRPNANFVVDAHSLYMQTLDELGIVGLLLLIAVILIVLGRTAARIRGPSRPLYAATFAVLLALAIHTGVDWDWQMPVITVIFFVLGGFMLARPRGEVGEAQGAAVLSTPSQRGRVLIGLGCLLLAVAPTYVWLSQRKLGQALTAFSNGNCPVASREALSSISVVGVDAEPYEILSYCDIRRNQPRLALTAINEAISLEPKNYSYTLDLALVRAAAGLNPLSAARKAVSLNPLDPLVQEVWQTLSSATPPEWEADGKQFVDEFTSL